MDIQIVKKVYYLPESAQVDYADTAMRFLRSISLLPLNSHADLKAQSMAIVT
jgi:hypothetical protein